MIKKKLKIIEGFFTLLIITGVVFSNVPFNVFNGLIDSYEKTSGIVDKTWQLEQKHDSGIVDKFVTLRSLSDKLRIHEAQASSFVAVAHYNLASSASGLVTKPTGVVDGDIMFALVMRYTAAAPTTVPAGWTELGNHVNGVYQQRLYWKLAASEGANYTWGWAAATKTAITIAAYRGGFNTADPIDVVSNTQYIAGTTAVQAASMNVTAPNSSLFWFGTLYSTSVRTWTKPSIPTTGWVEDYDGGATTSDFSRTIDSMVWTGSGATGIMQGTVVTGGTTVKHAFAVALNPVPVAATTTLSNLVSAEPGNSTIAPSGSGNVDSFGLVDSSGTDTVNAVTVGLTAGMGQYIQTVAITNDAGGTTYCSGAPSTDTASLSGCTIPVTTTNTQFKIKITADPHSGMPVPPGGSYNVTGTITGWTGTNATHAGTDSGSSTVTIDNLSPNGATAVSGTTGNTANTINWTTSNSADFDTTSGSVVLRWTSASAGSEVPVEGNQSYVAGNTIIGTATATVACVISSAASTAQSKIDGTGGSAGCTTAALTNGQPYTYKVFQAGLNGNYDVGVGIGTFTPVAPAVNITMSNFVGGEPGNFTIAPGASAQVDSFGIVAASGTDTLTNAVVTMTTGMGQYIGNVALTNDGDTTTYCTATPSGDTATFTGCTLPVTTTNTQFKVRLTADAHNLMPAPQGATYATTATITSWTVTGTEVGTDSGSSTTTIDNLSPGATTGATATPGDAHVDVSWTNPGDADFQKVIIYCKTSAITESPTEGTDPAVDGTACDGTARVKYSGSTSPQTFSGLTNGTTYYFRIYARDTNGNFTAYASTQTVNAQPVSVTPTITTYTNATETTLNYANCGTTGCGARIGGGSIYRQSITITGTNLGTVSAGSRSTSTNNIKVGTHQIADANISVWTPTNITFLTDTTQTGDADADWGTNFGGASALTVTASSNVTAGLNFYVFPQITSVSTPSVADAAREYDAGDTDGIITLNGTRFGTALGSGSISVLGSTGTTTSWNNTAITVQVPVAIADTLNTGSLILTQGTGSNGKTNTYTGFRILPRITSLSPSSGIISTAVTVNGNHLCQSGTCPGSFSTADKVTFTSGVVATTFTSWSATAIVTAVPTGAATGNVFVTSNTSYTSNNSTFTVAAATTTLATGTDPSATTIAPGAAATDVDSFTLQTNVGTESITSVTVNLSTLNGIGLLAITNSSNTVLGSTASPSTGSNVITVSGMSATTSPTTFKVRVTPLSHVAMPAPAGGTYAITAPVTAWAGGNTHAGSDTNTNALSIDNASPANVTSASGTAGDSQVVLNWTNPADADFHSTIVLRRTVSVVTDVPVEGTTYTVGNTIGSSTVACVVASPTATCTDSSLSNGTAYYYKIFTKDSRVNYSVTGVVPTGSPLTPTLTQVMTVGTVGTQATNLNSGTTAQHIGGGATAAFTLQINTSTSNVTSVKISDTGTVAMANLTNPKLYYENATSAAACSYGGAESSVTGAAPVGETVTFTLPTVAVGVAANVTCLYFVSDISSSASGGQTIDLQITNPSTDVVVSSGVNTDTVAKAIAGTTTIKPQITGYTNTTETALNYAASCTSCGARIGGGSGFRQSITIPGYGFGADPGAANRSTATNNVKVGTHQIASANVTAWSNTSITFLTDSATTGDTDADWGTNFGGATSLKVTAGSQAVPTSLNFYIYPQITSVSTPSVGDAAREYDAGDTDGIITLNGTRFGSSLGSGSSTVLSSSATTNSWSNTSIELLVPTAISDSTYTGTIAMTQGTGSNGKTNSYFNSFRILPRIISLSPSGASIGEPITINGNHFCQTGTCPVSFSVSNKVTFTTAVSATVFTSWSHTAIVTAVPTGSITGAVVVTSNAFTSNGSDFALASAIPNDPTNITQFKDAGFTQPIVIGGMVNVVPIYLNMTMEALISGGALYPQVEYKPIGTAFVCTGTSVCADAVEGTGVSGLGPTNGSVSVSPTDNTYHWQARVKNTRSAIDYYSAWVSFDDLHPETDIDFQLDSTAPVITSVSSGTPGTNGATISWLTSGELSTSQIQYNKTGTFVSNCATNNDCTSITNNSPMVNSHSVILSNLDSGTMYSYRVRSKDVAGNEIIDTIKTFSTQTVANPAKTIKYEIDSVSSGVTSYFKVDVPEDTPTIQNAFIEVLGIVSGGTGTVTVKANNVASRAYDVNASNPTLYHFLYEIPSPGTESNLNKEDESPCSNSVVPGTGPLCNNIIITPTSVGIDILSAKIIINYSYLP